MMHSKTCEPTKAPNQKANHSAAEADDNQKSEHQQSYEFKAKEQVFFSDVNRSPNNPSNNCSATDNCDASSFKRIADARGSASKTCKQQNAFTIRHLGHQSTSNKNDHSGNSFITTEK